MIYVCEYIRIQEREVIQMKRDIEKAYEEYKKLENQGKAILYCSEIEKIYDMSDGDIALMGMISYGVGVTVGYRLAKRDMKKVRD